ncbi:beta-ketoacyl synthase N-terminal-like domain-containing protein [Streptomyces sp. NPDC013455]|uniref:beta-ketoacyl synthase N-terminal-like domain-containing protein n=1 Tax=Streptomyces sp. NPDC013455 TaxID=3155605 RepID=UPI0033E8F274
MTAPDTVAEAVVASAGIVLPPDPLPADGQWFDVKARLGRRGYRYLPESCHYLLAAARDALAASGDEPERHAEERRGVVVGTNSAVAGLHADIVRAVGGDGIDGLSPMTVPFFSVNLVAAKLSTEHRFKGFNLTVTSPRVAGLEAVHLAAGALAAGRGDVVLAGGAEAPDPRAGDAVPESGAVLLLLRPAGAEGGTVVRTALRFLPPRATGTPAGRERAGRMVRAALDGVCPAPPAAVHLVTDGSPTARTAADAVRDWCGAATRVTDAVTAVHAGALAPLRLLAHALRPDRPAPEAVVVASGEGNLAFAAVDAR